MLSEYLIKQTLPLSVMVLGVLMLVTAKVLKAGAFLNAIGISFILYGAGLGIQSLLGTDNLRYAVPLTTVLYLWASERLVTGVSLRSGKTRPYGRTILILSLLWMGGAIFFSYVEDNLLWRMVGINTTVGLIIFTYFPLLWRNFKRFGTWDRVFGVMAMMVSGIHLWRAGYLGKLALLQTDQAAFPQGLTTSAYWEIILASSFFAGLSLWFAGLFCAIQDRIESLRQDRDKDPLTGLLNRRGFFEKATHKIAKDPEATWVILAGDLDHFKQINDRWSHRIGDLVLMKIADVLQKVIGPRGVAARFGGEEFIVLLKCDDLQNGKLIADQIRDQVGAMSFEAAELKVTISIGVSALQQGGQRDLTAALDQALIEADHGLYQAKFDGRDRVVIR